MNTTEQPRVPLYDRLPEIYRIRDAQQTPPDQLKAYLAAFESVFAELHANIEALYHDLFIETCDDWVIPYIADLLGTTHLKGDSWTLRADVADTIPLRRRKGTLHAMERLTANLTGWAARAIEMRDTLAWHQHLNHQRPDAGGSPVLADPERTRFTVPRGGFAPLRDPAMLSLRGTAFDPFAYTADIRPAVANRVPHNLPNLAIFLWRLAAYRIRVSQPVFSGPEPMAPIPGVEGDEAEFGVRFEFHPLGRPVRLFNTYRFDPRSDPPRLTAPDEVPGPIPGARLTSGSEAGNPEAYVDIDVYSPGTPPVGLDLGEAGIQIFLPDLLFSSDEWRLRGDNLCAWEGGLRRTLHNREIVIDPEIGRLLIGVAAQPEAEALRDHLLVGYTYGSVGPIGAHPINHGPRVTVLDGMEPTVRIVNGLEHPDGLRDALADIHSVSTPIQIEIADSLVHDLDLDDPILGSATSVADGDRALLLARSLVIRAADGHRPIIRLAQPLRLRPATVVAADPADQDAIDGVVRNLTVRLEGVHLTWSEAGHFLPEDALIARAAVGRIEIVDASIDPGGFREHDGTRAPMRAALALTGDHGFIPGGDEELAFQPLPDVLIHRSITGALKLDEPYLLTVEDSIVDAGVAPASDPGTRYAIASASDFTGGWSAPVGIRNATLFGRIRTLNARGRGGIFVGPLEVLDNQTGCIKHSWFWPSGNRLPQNHACVDGNEAELRFTSTWFGDPGYAQIARATDFRVRERGPDDDAMGSTHFLFNAHRWANLQIRLREFMPVGVRPVTLTAT